MATNTSQSRQTGTTLNAPSGGVPTNEEIRIRAYEKFRARNGLPGDPLADWLAAESELRNERQSRRSASDGGRTRIK